MTVWAISDLHLSSSGAKPMEIFGACWEGHARKISSAWRKCVEPDDTVLIPGDVSWALRLEEALPDLSIVASLPGRKIMLRGNHDYWWKSLSRVRAALPEGFQALQNDAFDIGGAIVAGTRGWSLPGSELFVEGRDEAAFAREADRLAISLSAAARARDGRIDMPLVVMMHYPPSEDGSPTPFTDLISASGASVCIFGHLHGPVWPQAPDFELGGVSYRLVSADWLDFEPVRITL